MSAQAMMADIVDTDRDRSWLYRLGGISALALGIGYIIIIALYVPMGTPPSGGEARLVYIAANTTGWWAILGLSVATDFLFIPVVLALYVALKGINRNLMLIATALMGLFVVLDLAITWPNYATLITFSGDYATLTNEAQRAAYVTAANYASVVLESRLIGAYIILVPGLGILLTGLVMLRGIFSKTTAYLGIATGIFAIVSVVGPFFVSALGLTAILASVLTTVWLLFVGFRLNRR